MAKELTLLLGNEHSEPTESEIRMVSPDVFMGISSVVDKSVKSHNYVNNEDACGVFNNLGKDDILLSMVADSHSGYVASHQGVQKFPDILMKRFSVHPEGEIIDSSAPEQVMQAYLEAFIDFYDQMIGVGDRSGVTYMIHDRMTRDISSSTFSTILKVGSNYYSITGGDSFAAIIRDGKINVVKPRCQYFFGSTELKEKIREVAFGYERKYREISESFREKFEEAGEDREALNKVFEEESAATRALSEELIGMADPNIGYDEKYVRRVVSVHKLETKPGDVLFQCTDGIELDREDGFRMGPPRALPGSYIAKLFSENPLSDAMYKLFQGIQKREFDIAEDNVAAVAMGIK